MRWQRAGISQKAPELALLDGAAINFRNKPCMLKLSTKGMTTAMVT
jgi:hypothetical protein